ncbi:MAG: hypothetical protein MK075_00995, partial [Phycisphaerales bacterium]|nr:hypothetical protein [Phycisphaerales bacterium]
MADGFIHQLLLVGVEFDLNDLLHATGAQDTWHTDEASADAILVIGLIMISPASLNNSAQATAQISARVPVIWLPPRRTCAPRP